MLILVTNSQLCKDDFLQRIDLLTKGRPYAIMLREKDLNLKDYEALAVKVKEICEVNDVPLIINQNISVAKKLAIPSIQLSMDNLRKYQKEIEGFSYIGASVHSISEAIEAQQLGATALIAGHIFTTDSKKGVPARGLSFLKEVCEAVTVPVFAIGGIKQENVHDVLTTGAQGICVMSEAMTCHSPDKLRKQFGLL